MGGKRVLINLLLVAVYFFSICVADCSNDLKDRAIQFFGSDLPGLMHLLQSKKSGDLFELYSGIYIQGTLSQRVLGFDLEIKFANNEIKIPGNRCDMRLRTTEFDIVTENSVIECKSSAKPSTYAKEYFRQFDKEQTMLDWLALVGRDYDNKTLKVDYYLKHDGAPVLFKLRGYSTCNKDIGVEFSWIRTDGEQDYVQQLISLVKMLASKKFVVFFKEYVPVPFKEKLEYNNIAFCEGIDEFTSEYVEA
jgi:hypothetical protein